MGHPASSYRERMDTPGGTMAAGHSSQALWPALPQDERSPGRTVRTAMANPASEPDHGRPSCVPSLAREHEGNACNGRSSAATSLTTDIRGTTGPLSRLIWTTFFGEFWRSADVDFRSKWLSGGVAVPAQRVRGDRMATNVVG
jgi:hypothetical protein